MGICKYGEICSSSWPCEFHVAEAKVELRRKEREAEQGRSFFRLFETTEEREEREARETLARIEREREERRRAASEPVNPYAALAALGIGAAFGIAGAVTESDRRRELRNQERKERGPMTPAFGPHKKKK